MLCYNFEQYVYVTSLHFALQMKANKFFLVVITVSFDSNSQVTNYDISSCTQHFYSKEVVVL